MSIYFIWLIDVMVEHSSNVMYCIYIYILMAYYLLGLVCLDCFDGVSRWDWKDTILITCPMWGSSTLLCDFWAKAAKLACWSISVAASKLQTTRWEEQDTRCVMFFRKSMLQPFRSFQCLPLATEKPSAWAFKLVKVTRSLLSVWAVEISLARLNELRQES